MTPIAPSRSAVRSPRGARALRTAVRPVHFPLLFGAVTLLATGCASGPAVSLESVSDVLARSAAATVPTPDPRVGLGAGLFDAGQAIWNLRLVSTTPPPPEFVGVTNSDLAFKGPYAIQGNYNGIQIWDLSNPQAPSLVTSYVCPASQSDVSVFGDLLFVSGEGLGGRLDCGTEGIRETVSRERLRGIRIFDISDIRNPRYLANVQTCRGSHTHTVLVDPDDDRNVYVYVSGSAPVRPAEELPGCSGGMPEQDPGTALFRIEVIRVPLDAPEQAAIVSSPRIFTGLVAPPTHGPAPDDLAEVERARAAGAFVIVVDGEPNILPMQMTVPMLDSIMVARGGTGTPSAADSAALQAYLDDMVAQYEARTRDLPRPGPSQCHDITVYPEIGLAGGACGGYGLLLDISDPTDPVRISAVSDPNFSYWHSATFDNDGTKVLFTDEWGGGSQPKCRASDPPEWGANAIFTVEGGREMVFQSYFKIPAPQTPQENCVAHNGSLIPVPGRDVMVQGWYQGGISVFDWTDPKRPVEIAFHDRGPVDPHQMRMGGSWSVYWYNGLVVSSEIARGLDVFELLPSPMLSQNEIDAAKTVRLEYLNAQGQPRLVWPPSFALARAYLDQLERSGGLPGDRIREARVELDRAERASGEGRGSALQALEARLSAEAGRARDPERLHRLAEAVRALREG